MKFVHAADVHLDSPLHGLERYEGAPVDGIRGATRRALGNLVGLCAEEEADGRCRRATSTTGIGATLG